MPRGARLVLPGVALHIVQRGVARTTTFFADHDYARYLALLGRFAGELGCSIHAYCLMTNHVHLLVTPPDAGACARLMKQLNQCHRYIELNPVRAGMVGHPRAYPWSSYLANAEGRGNGLVRAHPTYAALSARPEERISAYRTLFDEALPAADVEAIRRATRSGRRIGDPPRRRGPKKKKD